MIERLEELNKRFIQLYCQINKYKGQLPQKQLEFMQDKLFEQYKTECRKLLLQEEANVAIETWELQMQNAALIPKKKWRLFKNKAAKLIEKEMQAKIAEYYARRKAALEQEETQEEETCEVLDEEQEQEETDETPDEEQEQEESEE